MTQLPKKIAAGAALLLLVIVAAAAFVLGRLDRIVVHGVETEGPGITGTAVSLGDADISLFSGVGALDDLEIANPEGFASDYAFQLGEIAIEIDPASVMEEVVRIRSLTIAAPRLTAEFDDRGRNNLGTILDHVRSMARQPAGKSRDQEAGEPKRLIIERFRVVDAEVRAVAAPLQLDKTLKLPPIELKNLGAHQGGASAAAIADQAMRPLVNAAIKAARDEYLSAKGEEFKQQLKEKAGSLFDGLKQ